MARWDGQFKTVALLLLLTCCLIQPLVAAAQSVTEQTPQSSKDDELVKALVEKFKSLRTHDYTTQEEANRKATRSTCRALGKHGAKAKAAVPLLADYLKDALGARIDGYMAPGADEDVLVACQTLGSIGPDAKPAVPVVIDVLENTLGIAVNIRVETPKYREAAAAALGQIGTAKAETALRVAAETDPEESVRKIAAKGLEAIKRRQEESKKKP
jgi:HEAT repeat protein